MDKLDELLDFIASDSNNKNNLINTAVIDTKLISNKIDIMKNSNDKHNNVILIENEMIKMYKYYRNDNIIRKVINRQNHTFIEYNINEKKIFIITRRRLGNSSVGRKIEHERNSKTFEHLIYSLHKDVKKIAVNIYKEKNKDKYNNIIENDFKKHLGLP